MNRATEFRAVLESKVTEQLASQRVGYLLGAGSSYINGCGYPLADELWNQIKCLISDVTRREEIQTKVDLPGTKGLEHALDLLDNGGPEEGEHRNLVAKAIAGLFMTLAPPLDSHVEFVKRLAAKSLPHVKIFNLNYDPLIERAAEHARVRIYDGFLGHEHAYFDAATFEERIFRIRGTHRGRQPDETAKPLHLFKLHGSVGWYLCNSMGVRCCGFGLSIPEKTKHLIIPPQKRKADDTMMQPYQALWSAFRGALGQDPNPLNRLVCIGYGFGDEHVNTLIENALSRTNFTLLIFTKELSDYAWPRWSQKNNVIIITDSRCSLKGEVGGGHPEWWKFDFLSERI